MKNIYLFLFILIFSSARAQSPVNDAGKVYGVTEVDVQPAFPGGNDSMFTFLKKNLRYPDSAKLKGIQGKVFIQFIVSKAGKIGDIKILKGVNGCKACDGQAAKVVGMFPDWKPGEVKGEKVNVQFVLPVNFKLNVDLEKTYGMDEVDKQASFPGGDSAMFLFIGNNLVFADSSNERNVNSKTLLSFVVTRSGALIDIASVGDKSICPECDKVIEKMAKTFPVWVPAMRSGSAVDEKVLMPVSYTLHPTKKGSDELYSTSKLQVLPKFNGGDHGIALYFAKNIRYPDREASMGIRGVVYISFTITKTGEVEDAQVVQGVPGGSGIDAEALRVISNMPKWKPGEIDGKPVSVKFTIPIRF